jgi:hypothetical protein
MSERPAAVMEPLTRTKVGSNKSRDYSSNGGSGPMTQFEVCIFNLFQRLMRTGW